MSNCYECDTPLVPVCLQCNPDLSAAPSPAPDEVERVAVAMWKANGGECKSPMLNEYQRRATDDENLTVYRKLATAAISALRQRAAMDDLLRMDGELYDVPTPGDAVFVPNRPAPKLSEEERARVEEIRQRDKHYDDDGAWRDRAFLLDLIDKLTEVG